MKTKIILFSSLALIGFTSCDKDEPDEPIIPNESEVITSLTYKLINTVSGDTATFQYTDMDGDGGDSPVITADALVANQVYSGDITLLNQLDSPPLNVTEEVADEGADHQFFYSPSTDYIGVTYSDSDENGYPIGIQTHLTTGDAGTGTLTIILRHDPDKTASGVAEGNITNAGGETDIEVVFNVIVE